ncbi:hypothetical protein ACFPK9_14730 [Rubritalea spongiae]|uniref:TIGR03067 domain-containing protein n=1 Tax=Rubritalea spongiae TaxID=430797 RepID=A0ABW5DYH0_9BACT
MKRLLTALSCSTISISSLLAADTIEESNGIVFIELEDTDSRLGKWKLRDTNLKNSFSCKGYLEFTGNTPSKGAPESPLEYTFTINKDGLYFLHLRCAKETVEIRGKERDDVANDCYFRVEGNFEAGPKAADKHRAQAPLELLKQDTKFFGGADNEFVWVSGNRFDPGGHNNKRIAVYHFKAGETYKLVMSGRSQSFKVDCLAFIHADQPSKKVESLVQTSNK